MTQGTQSRPAHPCFAQEGGTVLEFLTPTIGPHERPCRKLGYFQWPNSYSFVAGTGRLNGRPVFLWLRVGWWEPFVATDVTGVFEDLRDQAAAAAVGFGDFGQG